MSNNKIQSEGSATAVSNNALDPDSFKSFKLTNIEKVNHNTSRFSFAMPSGTTELGLPVASCLVIKFADPDSDSEKPKVYYFQFGEIRWFLPGLLHVSPVFHIHDDVGCDQTIYTS